MGHHIRNHKDMTQGLEPRTTENPLNNYNFFQISKNNLNENENKNIKNCLSL